MLSGSDDGTVKFWDLDAECCLATVEGHTGGVTCIDVIPGLFGGSGGGGGFCWFLFGILWN